MTTNIEIICECGTTTVKARILLEENIGVLMCHVCGEKYESRDILNKERFGIADYRGGNDQTR